jgi:hypothetical protein
MVHKNYIDLGIIMNIIELLKVTYDEKNFYSNC